MKLWTLIIWMLSTVMFIVSVIPEDRDVGMMVIWGFLAISNQLAHYHEVKDD